MIKQLSENGRTFKFTCDMCPSRFNKKSHLNFHLRKVHNLQTDNSQKTSAIKCPLCSEQLSSTANLTSHLNSKHDVSISTKAKSFSTFEQFSEFKLSFEAETRSHFVMFRSKHQKSHKTIYYTCHRSGSYIPQGKGLRHLKTQDSLKINGTCPAGILVTVESDGKYKIVVTETHVGHETDIEHLHLSVPEKKLITTKIASKIPFDIILNEIRDSVSGSDLMRIHLLTRKDLNNIERQFNLSCSAVRHSNDAVSVDSWAKQMKNECVLYYKPQDCICDVHPELKSDDFVLVLMNNAQAEMMEKFGGDCICVDGTHGLNSYNFEIHTLMVIDDMRQGFPCAFLMSNRSDETVLKIFFSFIKRRTKIITPNVFMSDMAEAYLNAWLNIMGAPRHR